MRNFKIIMVVMSTVKCLMQCIVCNTVQSIPIYPSTVISMNDFTHKPEVFFHFFCGTAQSVHEIKIKHICCIQTDSIHIKFRYPESDCNRPSFHKKIHHCIHCFHQNSHCNTNLSIWNVLDSAEYL